MTLAGNNLQVHRGRREEENWRRRTGQGTERRSKGGSSWVAATARQGRRRHIKRRRIAIMVMVTHGHASSSTSPTPRDAFTSSTWHPARDQSTLAAARAIVGVARSCGSDPSGGRRGGRGGDPRREQRRWRRGRFVEGAEAAAAAIRRERRRQWHRSREKEVDVSAFSLWPEIAYFRYKLVTEPT
jgi:hypothetical protein